MIGQISVAAATAVVGYDLFKDQIWQQSPAPRVLSRIGVAGSTAAMDTKVSVYIGTVKVGECFNTATGGVLVNAHMVNIGEGIPPNEKVFCIVDDAPTTNAINIIVELLD